MKLFKFRDWELLVDREATQQVYDKIDGGLADGCECNACKNYINFREQIFPDEIKVLFAKTGIDYNKECENMHYGRSTNGLHSYHFWFHFKGKIINQKIEEASIKNSKNNNLRISFGNFQYPTFFENIENLIQVEFYTEIPWTIEKELENIYE